MPEFAVTAIGADRPGIVSAVAEVLSARGGNVEDSAMTVLGGHFAMVLLVSGHDTSDALHRALVDATRDLGLTITVAAVEPGSAPPAPTHVLSVYGADHPGILAGVARTLAHLDVNVTDVESRLLSPGDRPVYALLIECAIADADLDRVESALAEACTTLEVDHTLRPLETETY